MPSFTRRALEAAKKRQKLKTDSSISHKDFNAVQRQCLKKKSYSSLKLAEKVVRDIKTDRGTTMRVYECNICGFYHMTHRK